MNHPGSSDKLRAWLAGPLEDSVARALGRLTRSGTVERIAVMPDVHLCEEICIGTVVATSTTLLPHAVGGDIGCGMAALRFDCEAERLRDETTAARVLGALGVLVPARKHSGRSAPEELPPALLEAPLSHPRLEKLKRRDARVQLGTLGRGNHFLEFQEDDEGSLWVMVHSGSRAAGQAITAHHLERTTADAVGLRTLDASSAEGVAYLSDAEWACALAEASRLAMLDAVSALLRELLGVQPDAESRITCHHNHVRRERHFGTDLWVHRKGALCARKGEPGIIPGSMGAESFHVEGRGCAEALHSSSHGAGREMSRSAARRAITTKALEKQMQGVWFDHRLENSLREEAPAAYKDIHKVLRAQRELTKTVRRLRPLLSYKGT